MRAKGALPAPRTTPSRTRLKWYRRPANMVVLGLLVLAVLALGLKLGLDYKDRLDQRKAEERAVLRLERKLQLGRTKVEAHFGDMTKSTSEYRAGTLPAEQFKTKTTAWLAAFTELDNDIRTHRVPENLTEVAEARALFVRGTVVYVDAIRAYDLSASLTDATLKENAIQQGDNLISHATSVFGMGQRTLQKIKERLGLAESGSDVLGPVDLPPVVAPPAPPPAPEGAPPGGFVPPGGTPP